MTFNPVGKKSALKHLSRLKSSIQQPCLQDEKTYTTGAQPKIEHPNSLAGCAPGSHSKITGQKTVNNRRRTKQW